MIRKFGIILAAISLAACSGEGLKPPGSPENPLPWYEMPVDPEVKVYVLNQCLSAAQGPRATHYNDWDEAIEACNRVASNTATYCPPGAVCDKSAVSLEQVRAVLPKKEAK